VNPAVTDTLIIATIGIAGGAALIYIQVLIQWSLRKRHPAPPELPRELVEEISAPVEAPREAAPPPEEVAAPPPRMEAPPEVIAQPPPEVAPPPPEAIAPPPPPPILAPPAPQAPKAPPRLGLGLRKTRESFLARIRTALTGSAKLSEIYEGLEEALIGADVGVDTSLKLTESLRTKLKNESRPDTIRDSLKGEIAAILAKAELPLADPGDVPLVIMLVGVNGVGKTTTIAKLAARYKETRGPVLVAAGDTFRAAAIEQLEVWCDRAGVEIIKQKQGSDPAAVAFDAVKAAVARKAGTVLIDTAGRLQTKTNLMEELKKMSRVIARELPGAPHEVWLVLDATTGQNALSQAKIFGEATKLTGAVLAKLDSTAKGGVIVGIAGQLGIPVRFVGLGEGIEDLREFDPREFVDALFASGEGEGDSASGSYAA
jgi:fused signal recognition particle receptor